MLRTRRLVYKSPSRCLPSPTSIPRKTEFSLKANRSDLIVLSRNFRSRGLIDPSDTPIMSGFSTKRPPKLFLIYPLPIPTVCNLNSNGDPRPRPQNIRFGTRERRRRKNSGENSLTREQKKEKPMISSTDKKFGNSVDFVVVGTNNRWKKKGDGWEPREPGTLSIQRGHLPKRISDTTAHLSFPSNFFARRKAGKVLQKTIFQPMAMSQKNKVGGGSDKQYRVSQFPREFRFHRDGP